jgi:cell division septation protein DedD
MNGKRTIFTTLFGLLAFVAMASFLAGSARAQQTQQKPSGTEEIEVQYEHSKVVYVEGNHLVTEKPDGMLEAVLVPEDARFHMGDQVLTVHDLKPGMLLTDTITTTIKPMLLTRVDVTGGTIFHVNGERITIRDANFKLHTYRIPSWSKVMIEGEPMSIYDLRAGMPIQATILTEEPISVAERSTRTTVTPAPEPAAKAEPPATEAQPVEEEAAPQPEPQPAPTELPKTASPIPLIGLLGLLSLAASFGLKAARKTL